MTIFSFDSFFSTHYTAPPTVEDIEKYEKVLLAAISRYKRISTLLLIEANNAKLESEQRDRIAQLSKKIDYALIGQAIVIRMPGIQGTIIRTFVNGMNLLAKAKAPSKVFATLEDAKPWLCSLPDQPPNIRALVDQSIREMSTRSLAA